jgi:VCBS repeat-containing protein
VDDLVLATEFAPPDPINNAPVATGFTGGTGNEDTAIAGQVLASDADGDDLAYTVVTGDEPANGSVVVDAATGAFTYTPNGNFNGTDSFTVTVSDGLGGTTTQVVQIVVNAVNDTAVFGGDDGGAVQEDGTLVASGTLTVSDVDVGEGVFASTGFLTGLYGNFTFDLGTGGWTYTLRNGDTNVQALVTGQTVQDSLTVTSAGGSSTTIVVDIAGLDEPPPPVATLPPVNTTDADPTDDDTATAGSSGNNDTVVGTNAGVTALTGNGDDLVYAQGGNDSVNGGNQNDALYGQAGDDTLNGSQDNDQLFGGSGADSLFGDGQADTLVGGFNADTLDGGGQADVFEYKDVRDTGDRINNFQVGVDKIDLSDFGLTNGYNASGGASFSAGLSVSSYISGTDRVVIVDTDNDTSDAELVIYLSGSPAISSSDFIF